MPLYILACAMPKPIQKTEPTSGKEEEMFWRPEMIFSHPVLKFTQNQLPTFGTLGSGANRMDDLGMTPIHRFGCKINRNGRFSFMPYAHIASQVNVFLHCKSKVAGAVRQYRGRKVSHVECPLALTRRILDPTWPTRESHLKLAHCIILAVTGVAAPGSPVCQDLMTLWLKFSPIQSDFIRGLCLHYASSDLWIPKTFRNRAATHPDVLQRVAAGVFMLFDPRQRQST
ncbi:hypothetical protein B0H11DRAFT_1201652 [Mycena galericulata]|nr:hypothetical protein B0H11DRAFT_1201652 [Mycena galericulata]